MCFLSIIFSFLFFSNWKFAVGELENLQQRKNFLENQVQTISREQQHLANQLVRNGVHQVENSAKQLQIAQTVQTLAASVLASKGLNDVSIYMCVYLLNSRRRRKKWSSNVSQQHEWVFNRNQIQLDTKERCLTLPITYLVSLKFPILKHIFHIYSSEHHLLLACILSMLLFFPAVEWYRVAIRFIIQHSSMLPTE